jgi:hypothetical protein
MLSSLPHTPQLCSFIHNHVIILGGSPPSMNFQPQVGLLLLCLKNERLSDTFFLARGLSSDVVLRLYSHATSRNRVPVAASQQARVVYAGLVSQSLYPYNRRFADRRIIFHSSKSRGAFVVPDLPSLTHLRALPDYSCKLPECARPDDGILIPPY